MVQFFQNNDNIFNNLLSDDIKIILNKSNANNNLPNNAISFLNHFNIYNIELTIPNILQNNAILHLIYKNKIKKITTNSIINSSLEELYMSNNIDIDIINENLFYKQIKFANYGIQQFSLKEPYNDINAGILETINNDLAILKAKRADKKGNILYHDNNLYNNIISQSSTITIFEVDEIVDNLNEFDTEHIYVDRILCKN